MDKHLMEHLTENGFPFKRETECLACEDRAQEYRQEGWLTD